MAEPKSKPQQDPAQHPVPTWIARVNLGRQMRDAGEKMIGDALRERLDKVGESRWLKECEAEWGWSRTTAYRHLNPELLQKDRDRAAAVRSDSRNVVKVEALQMGIPRIMTLDVLAAGAKKPVTVIVSGPVWSQKAARDRFMAAIQTEFREYGACREDRPALSKLLRLLADNIDEGTRMAALDRRYGGEAPVAVPLPLTPTTVAVR